MIKRYEPFGHIAITLDHNFELAARQAADPARMVGAQWNNHRLARDPKRLDYRENLLDFLECYGIWHMKSFPGMGTEARRPALAYAILFGKAQGLKSSVNGPSGGNRVWHDKESCEG
jgi:hypothetical protein